jgi:ligand-binding sensor domain-containing protein
MNLRFWILFIGYILTGSFCGYSQSIPMGSWQTHFNYQQGVSLEGNDTWIYYISKQGFLMTEVGTQSLRTLSKLDGLSANDFSALAYYQTTTQKGLILGYESGQIDLITLNQGGELQSVKSLSLLKESTAIEGSRRINAIATTPTFAYLATDFGVVVIDLATQLIKETYIGLGDGGAIYTSNHIAITTDSLYLATNQGLLVAANNPNVNLQYFGNWKPISFKNQVVSKVFWLEGKLYTTTPKGIYQHIASQWQLIRTLNTNETAFVINKHIVVASIGKIQYIDTATILQNKLIQKPLNAWTDGKGSLWLADAISGLVHLQNQTASVHIPTRTDTLFQHRSDTLLIDQQGYRWFILNGGLIVQNSKTQQIKYLSTQTNEGSLPSYWVNSIALDRRGDIWIGTDNGVAVISGSTNPLGNVNAYRPVIDRRYLLANQSVKSIAIDGGNRKWMGTTTGAYLVNTDGSALLETYTTRNSSLPSNQIKYIGIDGTEGEVYFRTDRGMVSYRTTATDPAETLSESLIFPNPVRPDFGGVVSITDLVENTIVKITDVSGRLQHQTRSSGGTATWNLINLEGNRVETGIYLIWLTNLKGTETLLGKLAVVR